MLAASHRILIASDKAREGEFKSLFEREPLGQWEPLYADGFSKARYILQHNPCEMLLVHEDLVQKEGAQGLTWLAWRRDFPVVFVGQSAELFRKAYEIGVQHCLAYDMALCSPGLVHTVLKQARKALESDVVLARTREHLSQTRRHVDRLVTLMWRSSPQHGEHQWYSQPFLVERLTEELARAERHKVPFSLAVGELKSPEGSESILPDWTPDLLVKGKRRCDVVGQYGKSGFMLLMVQTPKHGGIVCCKRLQSVIEQPREEVVPNTGPRPALRAYFGLTTTDGDRHSVQAMLRAAEQNLEAARHETTLRIVAD